MKVLNHNDIVRLDTWVARHAKVGTLNGCQAERGKPTPVSLRYIADQYLRGGSDCWANTSPAFLSADKSHYERDRAIYASAIVLVPDEIVEIEGEHFRVTVGKNDRGPRPKYSNSLGFKRLNDASLKVAMTELLAEQRLA